MGMGDKATPRRRISVLGATGSIGDSTLDLIDRNRESYEIVALTAHRNWEKLAELARRFDAEMAVVADPSAYGDLKAALAGTRTEVAAGPEAMVAAGARPADWVMAAIVGAAGMAPALAAVRQGRYVALANKECLVAAGRLFMETVKAHGTRLIPVDSEHSAVFQALDGAAPSQLRKITLTASGGPFRNWPQDRLARVRPEDALKHPNWSMGPKITVDSATLMNKGLELIEAYYLFSVTPDQLDILIHPQSIVHCLVAYGDGSVLAQMSMPDMRTPIAYSLAWPERMPAPTQPLDLAEIGTLTFFPPDAGRFPAIRIAREAMEAGGNAPTILNAANEVAVAAFLQGRLDFLAIPTICETMIPQMQARLGSAAPDSLEEALWIDEETRLATEARIGGEAAQSKQGASQ